MAPMRKPLSHKPKTLLTLLAAHFHEQGGGP
jgi:hypothetical protein